MFMIVTFPWPVPSANADLADISHPAQRPNAAPEMPTQNSPEQGEIAIEREPQPMVLTAPSAGNQDQMPAWPLVRRAHPVPHDA
jgi:hypothetical protein